MFRQLIEITKTVLGRLKNGLDAPLHMAATLKNSDDIEEIRRYLDEEDRRHYTQGNEDVYSVTTVLDELDEGKEAIEWWKKHNDGEGDNPFWEDILEYKQDRGTLAHHAAMADHYEALNHGEQLWSSDETDSLYRVMDNAGDPSFLYSILADRAWVSDQEGFETLMENEDISLDDVLIQDLDYFTSEYDRITEELGINDDTLEAVEEMFVVPPNHEHDGYGGQADLVYRDPMTGEAVVADLKTSSAVRDKHKYQASAYAKAVEKTDNLPIDDVARAEIIRIYPDEEETEVYTVNDPEQHWKRFAETTKEM